MDYCRTKTICSEQGLSLRDDALAAGNLSTVMFGVGVAALAGGAFFWFTGGSSTHERTGITVVPAVGLNEGQLLVRGRLP
jgi:hypothetical protein